MKQKKLYNKKTHKASNCFHASHWKRKLEKLKKKKNWVPRKAMELKET